MVVVHDVDQRDGFVVRTTNDAFVQYEAGTDLLSNVIAPLPLTLESQGKPESDNYSGGWVNGELTFSIGRPQRRPSIYVHAMLENHISNFVALDLVEPAIIDL